MDKIINIILHIVLYNVILANLTNGDPLTSTSCYKCTVVHPTYPKNLTKRICSEFDRSDHYIVNCPYSTMCMKNIYTITLQNGSEVYTYSRDCAPQKHVEQFYKRGEWHKEIMVEEPYQEGCSKVQKGYEICYCHGHLCNSSPSTKDNSVFATDAMTFIFLFNALKFLKYS